MDTQPKPKRKRREMVGWYLIIAVFNALFFIALSTALAWIGIDASLAGVLALIPVLAVSYMGHKLKTFQSSGTHRRELPRFLVISAFDLLLTAAVPSLVSRAHIPHYVVFIVLSGLIPLVNFLLMRFWIFVER